MELAAGVVCLISINLIQPHWLIYVYFDSNLTDQPESKKGVRKNNNVSEKCYCKCYFLMSLDGEFAFKNAHCSECTEEKDTSLDQSPLLVAYKVSQCLF